MKICTCENCRFTFRYPLLPLACPDCGKDAVRLATEKEVADYWRMQEMKNPIDECVDYIDIYFKR